MKYLLILLSILFLIISCENDEPDFDPSTLIDIEIPNESLLGRIPCEAGKASYYPCNGYDLMSRLHTDALGVSALNDIWGWEDPQDGKEYALVGGREATIFIDISNPENPVILGRLPSETTSSTWRDIKVYSNHAFIVSEAQDHGMQVFDLTKLRNLNAPGQTLEPDAIYSDFGNAHNIAINEDTGYAYAIGTSTFTGGPHFINIQNPLNPVAAGGYDMSGYTHDAQVVTYNGPDQDYTGAELFLGSNENETVIVNVTDKSNPTLISTVSHTSVGYTHQGWFDENHQYYYANDERDETDFGFNSRTLIFDLSDLDNPLYLAPFFGDSQAIDHNLYTKGNELYLSNYTAGLRVADISDVTTISDIGFFDTFPQNDNPEFNGVWSVYPYFQSGNIIVSDVTEGMFILRKTGN